jgi:hypothetical protein
MGDVQAVLEQMALLDSHIGVTGTAEMFHELSDLPVIAAGL